jgi:hypothetical protein
VYVSVVGSYGNQITFSQNSITLPLYQTQAVALYGGSGGYYVSSNSNPSAVTASVNGTSLNLYGNSSGNASVTVCASFGAQCGVVYVTVGVGVSGLSLGQSSLNLSIGQSTQVSVSGSASPYISSNSSPQVVAAYVSGSTISVTALNSGTSTIVVCAYGAASCGTLTVTVGAGSSSLYIATTFLPQPVVGQYYSQSIQVTGGQAPYTFWLAGGTLPTGLSLSSSVWY